MKTIRLLFLLYAAILCFYGISAQQHIELDSIVIKARAEALPLARDYKVVRIITRDQIEKIPSLNLAKLLDMIGGVDVKYRGSGDVQADLSINGGSFNDVLILINGVPYIDYQTGHFNFNLPVSPDMIERIEILLGTDSRRYGVNSFSGAVNIITRTDQQGLLASTVGLYQRSRKPVVGFDWVEASTNKNAPLAFNFSVKQSDGYDQNTDYKVSRLFFTKSFTGQARHVSVQGGLLIQKFGALNFYTPRYPWQYEENNAEFLSLRVEDNNQWTITALWRRHLDKFELFRQGQGWYQFNNGFYIRGDDTASFAPGVYYKGPNYHANNLFSLHLGKIFISPLGKTFASLQGDYYFLHSTVMGDSLKKKIKIPFEQEVYFTKGAHRYNLIFTLNHLWTSGRWTVSAGLSQVYNSSFHWFSTWGMDASYLLKNKISLMAGINKSMRFPTFTEMYYSDAVHKGNPYLLPQTRWAAKTGLRVVDHKLMFLISGFYAHNHRQIEWVLDTATNIYHSLNLTDFTSYGINTSLTYSFPEDFVFFQKIFLSYTNLNYRDFSYPQSKYSANLLHHNFSASIEANFFKTRGYSMGFIYNTVFKQRFVSVAEGDKRNLFLNTVALNYTGKNVFVQLSVENLFDVQWYDYYTPMPGRTFILNIKFKF